MSSFGKVKSSAKVLAFIGENAYIFFVKTDVNRPIPTLASNSKLDQPDKMISSYRLAAGKVQTNRSFAGFELYLSDPPYGAGR
jgi:uncharacterized membrane protein